MATRDVILTEYRSDTRNFQRGANVYDRTLARQERLTNTRLGRIDQRWDRSTRSILASRTALSGLTAIIGTTAIAAVRNYAEEWRTVERALQSIGETSEAAQQGVLDLAIRTRGAVGGTSRAVQRMARATGDDLDTSIRRVQTLQQLMAVGGASGTERASVSLQLGQALQSGVLSGDEFRSIRENAPVEFLDALARAAGVTRAELRAVAEEQRLTTDVVLTALDSLAATADRRFAELSMSGEEAFNVLNAGLAAYFGRVDETLGATESINGAMASLGEYMAGSAAGAETMARAIQIVAGASLAAAGGRGVGALNRAMVASAAGRRGDVAAARQQVEASRLVVAQARRELDAANAKERALHQEAAARRAAGQAHVRAGQRAQRASAAQARAATALAGAEARATAASNALTAAQARLSLATRVTTATVRAFNSVMAFFGGPVGLAITLVGVLATTMATARTPVERLRGDLQELSQTLNSLQGINDVLASDYAALAEAQDTLARATRGGGEAAQDAAALEINAIAQRIAANEALRNELAQLARIQLADARRRVQEIERIERESIRRRMAEERVGLVSGPGRQGAIFNTMMALSDAEVQAFIDAERQMALATAEAGEALNEQQQELLETAQAHSEAAVEVLQLEGRVEELTAAAPSLEAALDSVAGAAGSVASQAGAASAGLDGLIGRIPALAQAARIGRGLAEIEAERQAALEEAATMPAGFERERAFERINGLAAQAIAEFTGEAQAIRDADAALEAFTDDAYLGSLSAQERAIERQNRQYTDLVAAMREAGATQAELDTAAAAHAQALANIETEFAERGGGSREIPERERSLSRLQELRDVLIRSGHQELLIEQSLNVERARLREILPDLISLGLSRAEAEQVLQAQLDATEDSLRDLRSAEEERARAFAKNILQDIRSAESLEDAIGRVADRLLDLAFDRAFDLLAAQFARLATAQRGTGGFLGTLVQSFLPGFASGGMIRGPGGPRADRIPIMASDGEYMVQARAVTPDTLPFLEAINRGAPVPRFADGGPVGAAAVSPAVLSPSINVRVNNNSSSARVEARQGPNPQDLEIFILDTVDGGILSGRFARSMGQFFGLRQKPRGGS